MANASSSRGGPPGPGYTLVTSGTLTTTDATPTTIVTVSPSQNQVIQYWFIINGRDTTNQIGLSYIRIHGIERGSGAPAIIASSVVLGGTAENASISTATVAASVSGNNVIMQVTGVAARNINWNCEVYSFVPV